MAGQQVHHPASFASLKSSCWDSVLRYCRRGVAARRLAAGAAAAIAARAKPPPGMYSDSLIWHSLRGLGSSVRMVWPLPAPDGWARPKQEAAARPQFRLKSCGGRLTFCGHGLQQARARLPRATLPPGNTVRSALAGPLASRRRFTHASRRGFNHVSGQGRTRIPAEVSRRTLQSLHDLRAHCAAAAHGGLVPGAMGATFFARGHG